MAPASPAERQPQRVPHGLAAFRADAGFELLAQVVATVHALQIALDHTIRIEQRLALGVQHVSSPPRNVYASPL